METTALAPNYRKLGRAMLAEAEKLQEQRIRESCVLRVQTIKDSKIFCEKNIARLTRAVEFLDRQSDAIAAGKFTLNEIGKLVFNEPELNGKSELVL